MKVRSISIHVLSSNQHDIQTGSEVRFITRRPAVVFTSIFSSCSVLLDVRKGKGRALRSPSPSSKETETMFAVGDSDEEDGIRGAGARR